MKKIIKVSKEVDQLEDIMCDSCGASCNSGDEIVPFYEYLLLTTNWGYGSLKDGQTWEAHVCEKCVDEKIVPLVNFDKFDYLV